MDFKRLLINRRFIWDFQNKEVPLSIIEKEVINEQKFARRIAFLNSFGYCVTAAGVTFVDAKLSSHPIYGARFYPLGYWICLAAPVIFILTILLANCSQSRKEKVLYPNLCLLFVGVISLFNFLPEIPHIGFLTGILIYFFISCFASWIHLPFNVDYWIDDQKIDHLFKMERIKELTTLWRTLVISLTLGYGALLIPWATLSWTSSKLFLDNNPDEIFINSNAWVAAIMGFSFSFLFGPVYEAFHKATSAADLLLRLKIPNKG